MTPDWLQKFRDAYRQEYNGILSDEVIDKGNKWFEDFISQAIAERDKMWLECVPMESIDDFPRPKILPAPLVKVIPWGLDLEKMKGFNSCRFQILNNAKKKGLI